jgi:membrane protein DedA with SNARE-associated domain
MYFPICSIEVAAVLDNLIHFFTTYGYFAVFGVLLLSGFGIPLPEDITLVAGGFISSLACSIEGDFLTGLRECHQVHVMFFVGMAGVLIGDSIMFFVGHQYGQRVLNIRIFSKIITPSRYLWAQHKFEKYGILFIFAARFMPGLRSPIFIVAGITRKVSFLKFLLTDGTAAIISVPVWVYLGFWGERQFNDMVTLEHYIQRGQISILFMLSLLIIGILSFFLIRRKIKNKYDIFNEKQ